jgi:hypothetical protein
MELKVKSFTIPEVIEFNYEELKKEITERTEKYINLVYTEEQIREAKKDVAMLRKFTKVLSDERIRVKKECMKAVEPFEEKVKELCGIVDASINNIDKQVKESEEKKKHEKYNEIREYFETLDKPEWLTLLQIFDEKWLNASTSMKSIQESVFSRIEKTKAELDIIAKLPEFSFEATEVYKDTLDMSKAVQETHRLSELQKRKAETEQLPFEVDRKNDVVENPSVLPPEKRAKQEVCFKCWLSTEDAMALKEFFNSRQIKYKAI